MNDLRHRRTTSPDLIEEVPLTVRLRLVSANSGRPLPGHPVRLWRCDHDGDVRFSDAAGWVQFAGGFPVLGPGRWPHVHFQINGQVARLALPADACQRAYASSALSRADLATVFADGRPLAMAVVTGDVKRGFVATRTVAV
jgi:hypothetical protein